MLKSILILFLGMVCAVSQTVFGQTTVTFIIDATDFVNSGGVLAGNKVSMAGTLSDRGGALPNWQPGSTLMTPTSTPTIYSRTITFTGPGVTADSLEWKYVQGTGWADGDEGNEWPIPPPASCVKGPNNNRKIMLPASGNWIISSKWAECAVLTAAPQVATITTDTITGIGQTFAFGGGNVTNQGGDTVTARGVCWSTTPLPTIDIANRTVNGSGAGSFTSDITGLQPNTQYYVRAYASNSVGTAYGSQRVFTTLALPPVKVTYKVDITNYLAGGATLGANGIRIGGNFTARGTTLPDWTPSAAACAMTNLGNNIWSITVTYPDSSKGKVQIYKFVNNDWGTNEGSDSLVAGGCGILDGTVVNRILTIPTSDDTVSFCWDRCHACFAPVAAVVSTDTAVTAITQTSATVSGGATGEGITKKGICYSINQNPTIADSLRSVGSGAGNFFGNLTNLTANTTYYARAYATNAAGTAYGAQVSFTTLPNPQGPPVKVTYRVNITNYLLGGATLGANGIRIGGNFTTRGTSLPDWTPSAAACGMTDLGNNIWSITVTYPDTAKGKAQRYKFVNNDWGTNEGSDSLVAGGCGVLDGADVNRILTIPTNDDTVSFCWDRCGACILVGVEEVTSAETFRIFPNPVQDQFRILIPARLNDAQYLITNILGETVAEGKLSGQETSVSSAGLPKGAYFIRIPGESKALRILKL
jgi:hypothetical protein